jgi:pimeloyl-ACP methyl ester carboxylesterase
MVACHDAGVQDEPGIVATERISVGAGVQLRLLRRDPNPAVAPAAPVVLVHGLASNAWLWQGAARALAGLGHPVVAVDQRGHGASDKPEHGYDMAAVADDLALLVEQLGWERPVVAGQSWGGNVVVELAYRRGDLVRGVVAVDGGMIELAERFEHWDDCAAALAPPDLTGVPARRLESVLRVSHPDWPDEAIAGTMANMEVLDDGTVRPWLPRDQHLQVLRGLWEHRPSQRFGEIGVPVLFCPADSGEVAWTHSKELALDRAQSLLPRCRVEWFRPADHDLHAQHPERFAAVVHDATQDGFFA